jgi:hypothetical protein
MDDMSTANNGARILEKPCLDHGYKGSSGGYASARRPTGRDKKGLLHRWIFQQEHGYLPEVVMHACDNPRCIEITHLVGGTRNLNNKDRAAKGRSAKSRPDRRKLSLDDVADIRERFARRTRKDLINGPVALAKQYGVDPNVIYQIAQMRTYVA